MTKQYDGENPSAPRAAALRIADTRNRLVVPLPKDCAVRDSWYLRAVAALPCAHCGRAGPSQAAHADEGKGMAIKSSDHETFPLCADSPGRQGCHSILGASGKFTRDQRRALERRYVALTREKLA